MALEKYIRDFKAEEVVFEEGSKGYEMFIIKEGKVRVEIKIKSDNQENIKNLGVIKEGEFFGEMSIIEGSPRSATVVAVEDCKLVALNKNRFYELIEHSPEFAIKIVRKLSERLKEANQRLKDHIVLKKKSKILEILVDKIEKLNEDSIEIDHLHEMIDIEDKTLMATLKQLEKIDLIKIEKKMIKVINHQTLDKITQFLSIL